MSEHETDLLEQTVQKMAWVARGMAALIVMGFIAGGWIARQEFRITVVEAKQSEASGKVEAMINAQNQILVSMEGMRVELRTLNERIEREGK